MALGNAERPAFGERCLRRRLSAKVNGPSYRREATGWKLPVAYSDCSTVCNGVERWKQFFNIKNYANDQICRFKALNLKSSSWKPEDFHVKASQENPLSGFRLIVQLNSAMVESASLMQTLNFRVFRIKTLVGEFTHSQSLRCSKAILQSSFARRFEYFVSRKVPSEFLARVSSGLFNKKCFILWSS